VRSLYACLFLPVVCLTFGIVSPGAVAADYLVRSETPSKPLREVKDDNLPRFFGLPRENPWVAGGLSIAVNGLGQFYNQEPQKGWAMASGWLLFPVAWVGDGLTQGAALRVFAYTFNMGVKVWSVWDAFTVAGQGTGKQKLPDGKPERAPVRP